MKYERVLWDFNGTLLDDLDICFECVNILLEKYADTHGCRPLKSIEEYRRVFRFPISEYYTLAGFRFDITPYEVLANEYMELYYERETNAPLTSGIEELLHDVRAANIGQVVLSASRLEYLRSQLEKRSILDCFDEVLGISDIYAASKLSVAKDWIARSGSDPHRMLMLGDTLHDAEVAKALGCECVLCSFGHQSLADFGGKIVDGIDEIRDILLK